MSNIIANIKGKEFIIKGRPLFVGEVGRIHIIRDMIIHELEWDAEKTTKDTKDFFQMVATAYVVTEAGLVDDSVVRFASRAGYSWDKPINRAIINSLLQVDLDVIKQIVREYNNNREPDIVKDMEEAKKK